jgi:hypothetical protein
MLDLMYQRDFGNQTRAFVTPLVTPEEHLTRRRESARRRLGRRTRRPDPV